jgi:hypothetical protein
MSATAIFQQSTIDFAKLSVVSGDCASRSVMNSGWAGSCSVSSSMKDPKRFDELVIDLNDLLELKHRRIHPEHKANPN